jgi:hypothetical protein
MLLRVNIHHYGFALAMPGTVLLVTALVGWVPRLAPRNRAWIVRGAILGAWAVTIIMMVYTSSQWIARRTHPVGDGADRFYADERGQIMDAARREIMLRTGARDTLVPVPGGLMLNYLSRRTDPARYQNYWPAEVMLFGEDRMLADLDAHAPEWIVLVHADTSIYDAPFFGRDYARGIAAWIRDHYHAVGPPIGARPFVSDKFGVLLMRRNSPPVGGQ